MRKMSYPPANGASQGSCLCNRTDALLDKTQYFGLTVTTVGNT